MDEWVRLKNADGNRLDLNDISLESLGSHLLFGEIANDNVKSAISFILKANHLYRDDISMIINTVGGSCSDSFALIDIMEASKLDIRTVGLGDIMSMGVLIVSAGTHGKRVMLKNTSAMAHQFSYANDGKYHEIVSTQKAIEYLRKQFIAHFKQHTKMSDRQINDILFGPTDRYLTPTECKKFGIIDHIVDELPDFGMQIRKKSSSR